MLYHAGAGNVTFGSETIRGTVRGLGGRIAFFVTDAIRLGGMGFNTGFEYQSEQNTTKSYVSLRFGGLTADYSLFLKNVRISTGVLLGGGGINHLHIISEQDLQKLVTYRKYGTFIIMPLLAAEVPVKENLSIALMKDVILGTNIIDGKLYGPRLHIGILFSR